MKKTETTGATPEAELIELARKIRTWQESRNLTTTKMLRRFPTLGSDRTYGRLISGSAEGLDIERQLINYRSAWALIEAVGDDPSETEDYYDDLSPVIQLRRAMVEAFTETGNARFILVQGDTGSGKTSAARSLIQRYGSRLLFMELSPYVGDSPYNFLVQVLAAMGIRNPPTNAMECYNKAVGELCLTRRCLIIDELHHAGPKILNGIKTLINMTPGEFVGLTMPTLWNRLEKAAYDECRQLTGNRLAERIQLDQINRADMQKIVTRRLPGLNGCTTQALQMLETSARGRGNLAFVRDVCRRALEQYDGEKITIEDFASVVAAEIKSR
jgi:Cdc6-like AAA superfamily ATPase